MPIYEYECLSCGKHFDFLQKIDDAPIKKCPECGGELKKLLSAPAFQFKGSGWYVTDYGRKQTGMKTKDNANAPDTVNNVSKNEDKKPEESKKSS